MDIALCLHSVFCETQAESKQTGSVDKSCPRQQHCGSVWGDRLDRTETGVIIHHLSRTGSVGIWPILHFHFHFYSHCVVCSRDRRRCRPAPRSGSAARAWWWWSCSWRSSSPPAGPRTAMSLNKSVGAEPVMFSQISIIVIMVRLLAYKYRPSIETPARLALITVKRGGSGISRKTGKLW